MIPDWLRDKLASPPPAGSGVHSWLFEVARQLHAHMPAAAVEAALSAATAASARRVTAREIRDAVKNSLEVAWRRSGGQTGSRQAENKQARGSEAVSDRWPARDWMARRMRILDVAAEDGIRGLADLWEASPRRCDDWISDDWLDWLFPSAEWLCLAEDHPATARSRRREKWSFGPAEQCGLVVPSPMTAPSGRGLDGRTSHRCLDNTGPRRWLVIEFDKLADGKTNMPIDEQAALHWHLRTSAACAGWPPLRLIVHSGGKSLHGWFGPCGEDAVSRGLMGYAVSLGADPATWNRCQLVRLPGGYRKPRAEAANYPDWPEPDGRQHVFFFDPCFSNSSMAPGAQPVSMQAPAEMAR